MLSNLPPGVSAHDLPGFDDEDVTLEVACDGSPLLVDVGAAWTAINIAVGKILEIDGGSPTRANRVRQESVQALADGYVRAVDVDTSASCDYDGPMEGIATLSTAVVYCPKCGTEHTVPARDEITYEEN